MLRRRESEEENTRIDLPKGRLADKHLRPAFSTPLVQGCADVGFFTGNEAHPFQLL